MHKDRVNGNHYPNLTRLKGLASKALRLLVDWVELGEPKPRAAQHVSMSCSMIVILKHFQKRPTTWCEPRARRSRAMSSMYCLRWCLLSAGLEGWDLTDSGRLCLCVGTGIPADLLQISLGLPFWCDAPNERARTPPTVLLRGDCERRKGGHMFCTMTTLQRACLSRT